MRIKLASQYRPPIGYRQSDYPLIHEADIKFAEGMNAEGFNTTILPIARHFKTTTAPDAVEVNPKHASYNRETGTICNYFSQIKNLQIIMRFNLTKVFLASGNDNLDFYTIKYMPIFGSFKNIWEADDKETGATLLTLLDLTKDDTEMEIMPTYAGAAAKMKSPAAAPLSTINRVESFAEHNLTTDSNLESTAFDEKTFWTAIKYFTNANALRSVTGKMRSVTLSRQKPMRTIVFRGTPKSIQRIVEYSFFGMMLHCPTYTGIGTGVFTTAPTANSNQIGIDIHYSYEEWNKDFDQTAM